MLPDRLHSAAVHEQSGVAHDALHRPCVFRIVIGTDPPFSVHQHELLAAGDDLLDWSREECPHAGAGAMCAGVFREPFGTVEFGIDAERHEVELGLEVARARLDARHAADSRGAGRFAAREHEARHPHAASQIVRAERAPVLRGELEERHRPEDRQARRQRRAERPGNWPGDDERNEDHPRERARDGVAQCDLEAIAKTGPRCDGNRLLRSRSDNGFVDGAEARAGGEA